MFLIVAAIFATFTQSALADTYTVTTTGGGGYGPYQSGSGGEFTLQVSDNLKWALSNYSSLTKNLVVMADNKPTQNFQTFCIEENEYIYPNAPHSATISNGAINGGIGGKIKNGTDPISIGTAWLYYQFAKGTLKDYDYADTGVGRKVSAAALQNTIWWLEGEASTPDNVFYTAIKNQFINNGLDPMADNDGKIGKIIPVAALNLWESGYAGNLDPSHVRQDQLIVTPIPAVVWLLGPGLLGLFGVRRKFRK